MNDDDATTDDGPLTHITHIRLRNWRNFQRVTVDLPGRGVLCGPNASGKSNFLDAVRFLHDVADVGGGLAAATERRGGVSRVRCLAARKDPDIGVAVEMAGPTPARCGATSSPSA